jgi:hypothetical protein
VHVSLLYFSLFAAVLAAWRAVGLYAYQAKPRRDRRDIEFDPLASAMTDLGTELDRLWGSESERIRWLR